MATCSAIAHGNYRKIRSRNTHLKNSELDLPNKFSAYTEKTSESLSIDSPTKVFYPSNPTPDFNRIDLADAIRRGTKEDRLDRIAINHFEHEEIYLPDLKVIEKQSCKASGNCGNFVELASYRISQI